MCFKTQLLAIKIEQIHVKLVTTFVSGIHTSFIYQPPQINRVGNILSLMRRADAHELFTLFRIEKSKTLPCLAVHMSTSSYRPYKGVQPTDQ